MANNNVDDIVAAFTKDFGVGSLTTLGAIPQADKDAVSTGSIRLDNAIGIGGLPRGRVVEVFGPEASGKSTLALHMVAEFQKEGLLTAFIDAEHAMSPQYAAAVGVDLKSLLFSQPDCGEQAFDIISMLLEKGVSLIIVDSVPALVPKAEIEGVAVSRQYPLQAALMSNGLRKITALLKKSVVVFINQTRLKVGVVYGDPESTPGGKSLKFYSTIRIRVATKSKLKKGNNYIGNRVSMKVVKNKVAPPFQECETDIIFGQGISLITEVSEIVTETGVLEKSGNSYVVCDSEKPYNIGGTKEEISRFLLSNPDILTLVVQEVRAKFSKLQTEITQMEILYNALISSGKIIQKGAGWCHYKDQKFLKKNFVAFLKEHPELKV